MRQLPTFPPIQSIFGAIIVLSILLGIATELYLLMLLPLALLLAYVTVVDYRKIYYLLLACLPLSTEYYFPNGFGTDLPTEPIIVGLMMVFIFQVFYDRSFVKSNFLRHPITVLLLLHLGWIFITTITSTHHLVSIKYFVAKVWYIIVFYFLTGRLLQTPNQIKTAFWWILLPMLLTMIYVNIGHAAYSFSFDSIYRVLSPFYRNHVAYACIMAVFFPFVWYAVYWHWEQKWLRWFLISVVLFFVSSIYFSYTRAAYVALLILPIVYFIIRLKWMLYAIGGALLAFAIVLSFMVYQNNYLEYAPNYERTITHTEFDNLLEATYKLEDISTMERFHRWIGGFFMVEQKTLLGFGPGNFYDFYKPYTINSFRTYVSENPEKSGIHNYYLMTAVEQGIPGLIIFLLLCCYVLMKGQYLYHQTQSPFRRTFILATFFAFIVICSVLIINDLIETDKIGSFFFICLALLVNLDLLTQKATA